MIWFWTVAANFGLGEKCKVVWCSVFFMEIIWQRKIKGCFLKCVCQSFCWNKLAVKVKHHENTWTQCVCTALLLRWTRKKNETSCRPIWCRLSVGSFAGIKLKKSSTMQKTRRSLSARFSIQTNWKFKKHTILVNLHIAASSIEKNWEHELSCICCSLSAGS